MIFIPNGENRNAVFQWGLHPFVETALELIYSWAFHKILNSSLILDKGNVYHILSGLRKCLHLLNDVHKVVPETGG